ncbi:hypothetical protein [Rhizobium sp.]
MRHSPVSIYFDLFRLACESSMVISLRMMTFATGGARAASEAQLMLVEKMQAASAVMVGSAFAAAGGKSAETIGRNAVAHYKRKVIANRKRLLRSR